MADRENAERAACKDERSERDTLLMNKAEQRELFKLQPMRTSLGLRRSDHYRPDERQ